MDYHIYLIFPQKESSEQVSHVAIIGFSSKPKWIEQEFWQKTKL